MNQPKKQHRRRRPLPTWVVQQLTQEFSLSYRTLYRRLKTDEKIIARAIELVGSKIESHQNAKALTRDLKSALNQLYTG